MHPMRIVRELCKGSDLRSADGRCDPVTSHMPLNWLQEDHICAKKFLQPCISDNAVVPGNGSAQTCLRAGHVRWQGRGKAILGPKGGAASGQKGFQAAPPGQQRDTQHTLAAALVRARLTSRRSAKAPLHSAERTASAAHPRATVGGPAHSGARKAAPGARGSEENIGKYACPRGRGQQGPPRRGQRELPQRHVAARATLAGAKLKQGGGPGAPAAFLSQLPTAPSQARGRGATVFSGRQAQRVRTPAWQVPHILGHSWCRHIRTHSTSMPTVQLGGALPPQTTPSHILHTTCPCEQPRAGVSPSALAEGR